MTIMPDHSMFTKTRADQTDHTKPKNLPQLLCRSRAIRTMATAIVGRIPIVDIPG